MPTPAPATAIPPSTRSLMRRFARDRENWHARKAAELVAKSLHSDILVSGVVPNSAGAVAVVAYAEAGRMDMQAIQFASEALARAHLEQRGL